MVREQQADFIIKGSVHTDELMGVLIDKTQNLRTERRMSHVWLMESPRITSFWPWPIVHSMWCQICWPKDILQNAIDFAHALDIEQPKVAILAAVEEVKPQMQSTIDAAALCKMADRGQITGALLWWTTGIWQCD